MARRTDRLIEGKLRTSINPKDAHVIGDYVNPRERRVLEFIVLILYQEKPGRITLTVGNTIFGALSRVRMVD